MRATAPIESSLGSRIAPIVVRLAKSLRRAPRPISNPPALPDPSIIADWLDKLGFAPDVLGWSVARLSTGERQRLALVRLLAQTPEVLLLDEATANLDPSNGARVESVVETYRKRARRGRALGQPRPGATPAGSPVASLIIRNARLEPEA